MFTRAWGANPSVPDRFAAVVPSGFTDDTGNNLVSGGSRNLANDFLHGANPGGLGLTGLVPGRQYILTMYSTRWDPQGQRQISFTAGGGQRIIDQDAFGRTFRGGIAISYTYTADASGTV